MGVFSLYVDILGDQAIEAMVRITISVGKVGHGMIHLGDCSSEMGNEISHVGN